MDYSYHWFDYDGVRMFVALPKGEILFRLDDAHFVTKQRVIDLGILKKMVKEIECP